MSLSKVMISVYKGHSLALQVSPESCLLAGGKRSIMKFKGPAVGVNTWPGLQPHPPHPIC